MGKRIRIGLGKTRSVVSVTPTPTPSSIPTPTLTETTSPANSAPTFNIGVTGYPVGYFWNIQLASDAAFTLPLSGEGVIRDGIRIVTVEDITDDDLDGIVESDPFPEMVSIPSGNTYVRLRLGYDDSGSYVWGDWSNTIFENVVTLTNSIFDATAKGIYVTRSGGNLTITNTLTNVGSGNFNRADSARNGKRYAEFTLTAHPSSTIYIGVGPAGFGWTTVTTNAPGHASSTAGGHLTSTGSALVNGATTAAVTAAFATGNVIMVAFDTATNKVWFGRNGVWNGDPSAGTGGFTVTGMAADWYAFAGFTVKNTDQRSVTANFGASAFAHTIPTGFSAYT